MIVWTTKIDQQCADYAHHITLFQYSAKSVRSVTVILTKEKNWFRSDASRYFNAMLNIANKYLMEWIAPTPFPHNSQPDEAVQMRYGPTDRIRNPNHQNGLTHSHRCSRLQLLRRPKRDFVCPQLPVCIRFEIRELENHPKAEMESNISIHGSHTRMGE